MSTAHLGWCIYLGLTGIAAALATVSIIAAPWMPGVLIGLVPATLSYAVARAARYVLAGR